MLRQHFTAIPHQPEAPAQAASPWTSAGLPGDCWSPRMSSQCHHSLLLLYVSLKEEHFLPAFFKIKQKLSTETPQARSQSSATFPLFTRHPTESFFSRHASPPPESVPVREPRACIRAVSAPRGRLARLPAGLPGSDSSVREIREWERGEQCAVSVPAPPGGVLLRGQGHGIGHRAAGMPVEEHLCR